VDACTLSLGVTWLQELQTRLQYTGYWPSLSLRSTAIGPVIQMLIRMSTRNTAPSRARYNCGMGRVAPFVVDALLFVRNRKTVPHSDLARNAVGADFLSPPMYQAHCALSFAGVPGTRRGVRYESCIEESEELPEERLQRWNGQSNKRRANLGHFYGQQAVVAPGLVWLYVGSRQHTHCEFTLHGKTYLPLANDH